MQVIRTIAWIVLTAVLVAFIAMNWDKVTVNLWPSGNGYINVESRMGYFIIIFLILGSLPVWLYHRASKWRLNRRIASLENSLRATSAPALVTPSSPPVAAPETAPALETAPETEKS